MDTKDSFLFQHYKRFRDAGGDHAMYVVYNDIDDLPVAKELRKLYEGDK